MKTTHPHLNFMKSFQPQRIQLLYHNISSIATGELVYVNYGTFEDFEKIKDVNLTGKIVIVRYGEIFRGNKAQLAAERGAIGVLIYIDPADTGTLHSFLPSCTYPEIVQVRNHTDFLYNGSLFESSFITSSYKESSVHIYI
jgi:hypothetical protein